MRGGRACWGGALLVVLLRCASVPREDRPKSPTMGCAISCPSGKWQFRPQHMCIGPRYFQDILIRDRKTTRGVDGTKTSDVWVTEQGDYPVVDVELGTCSAVIQSIVARRSIGERGEHPGEDFMGRPEPPQ